MRADPRRAVAEHATAIRDQGVTRRNDIINLESKMMNATIRAALKEF